MDAATPPFASVSEPYQNHMASWATRAPPPESIFKQGKFVGQTFEKIAQEDRQYAAWAIREQRVTGQLSRNLAGFAQYVKEAHGGVMAVGKHKGLYYDELVSSEPEYTEWCMNISRPGDALEEFVLYARQQTGNTMKSRREANLVEHRCGTCLEQPLNAAWVPCGHTVTCYECATMIGGRCPVCRQPGSVLKLFVG